MFKLSSPLFLFSSFFFSFRFKSHTPLIRLDIRNLTSIETLPILMDSATRLTRIHGWYTPSSVSKCTNHLVIKYSKGRIIISTKNRNTNNYRSLAKLVVDLSIHVQFELEFLRSSSTGVGRVTLKLNLNPFKKYKNKLKTSSAYNMLLLDLEYL